MKHLSGLFFIMLSIVFTLANSANAQTYSYPELNVVPRASARLLMESKWERRHRNGVHLAVQISAASTLIAGAMADVDTNDDEDELSSKMALGFGAGWLALTVAMSRTHLPYTKGLRDIKKIKGRTKRDQLTKERLAEEHINNAASLGKRIKWLSFSTNFISNVYLASKSTSESTGQIIATVGALLAFTPFLFNYHWEGVAAEQQKYKKKIYAPIAYTGALFNPIAKKVTPGLIVSLKF
jgi:hypothetical protein